MADTPRQSKRHRPQKGRKVRSGDEPFKPIKSAGSDVPPRASFGKKKKQPVSQPLPLAPSASSVAEPPTVMPPVHAAPANPAPHVAGLLPYGAGLAVAAALSFSIATAIILAGTPPVPVEAKSTTTKIAAENPPPENPAPARALTTQQLSQSLANIRIVDRPPPRERASCEDSVWPYIDKNCLAGLNAETEAGKTAKNETTAKDETTGETTAAKIGPNSVDFRPPKPLENAKQRDVPIGSLTAIIPARPKARATDGIATREAEPPAEAMELRPLAPRRSTSRTLASIDRPPEVVKSRKSVRVAEQPQYRAKAERKKKRRYEFADTTPRTSHRRVASERPQMPTFFFPFGLFTQAR